MDKVKALLASIKGNPVKICIAVAVIGGAVLAVALFMKLSNIPAIIAGVVLGLGVIGLVIVLVLKKLGKIQ